jgi:hypothetical protein
METEQERKEEKGSTTIALDVEYQRLESPLWRVE